MKFGEPIGVLIRFFAELYTDGRFIKPSGTVRSRELAKHVFHASEKTVFDWVSNKSTKKKDYILQKIKTYVQKHPPGITKTECVVSDYDIERTASAVTWLTRDLMGFLRDKNARELIRKLVGPETLTGFALFARALQNEQIFQSLDDQGVLRDLEDKQ